MYEGLRYFNLAPFHYLVCTTFSNEFVYLTLQMFQSFHSSLEGLLMLSIVINSRQKSEEFLRNAKKILNGLCTIIIAKLVA